jgi:hypothetical protein
MLIFADLLTILLLFAQHKRTCSIVYQELTTTTSLPEGSEYPLCHWITAMRSGSSSSKARQCSKFCSNYCSSDVSRSIRSPTVDSLVLEALIEAAPELRDIHLSSVDEIFLTSRVGHNDCYLHHESFSDRRATQVGTYIEHVTGKTE